MLNPFMRWLNRSPTVAERLKVHWQILQLRGYTPQTLRLKRHYTSILIKQFGWRKLDRVTRLELHQWLAERAKTTPSHTKSLLIFIRDFYREAINDGVTKYNPADRIKLQPHAVKRKRLSDAEYLRMLDRIPKDHYFLRAFKLALTIGQRRADIVKLKFSDVWDGHLHLIQQKNEKKHPAVWPYRLRSETRCLNKISAKLSTNVDTTTQPTTLSSVHFADPWGGAN